MNMFVESDETRSWCSYLETLDPPARAVTLPTGDALLRVLEYLEIPQEDIPDVIATAPDPQRDPDQWWILERAVWSLISRMGSVEQPHRFAALQNINDPAHRYFYVHVFVAALPYVQDYFRSRGIPEDIAQASLADLGRNIRVHRKREGNGGLGVMWWLMLHFRGAIYQLGRLQFERVKLSEEIASSIRAHGGCAEAGAPALSVHIPDFSGSMSPEACDDSIQRAVSFFATYFPDEPVAYAVCHSWLLDPQLKHYLKPESNIIRFQDRFTLVDSEGWDSSTGIMQFVFGKTPDQIDTVPQTTSLERGVASHLRDGGTWYGRSGWFALPGTR